MDYEHKHPESAPALTLQTLHRLRKESRSVSASNRSNGTLPSMAQMEVFLAIAEGANTNKKLKTVITSAETNMYKMIEKLLDFGLIEDDYGTYKLTSLGNSLIFYTDPE